MITEIKVSYKNYDNKLSAVKEKIKDIKPVLLEYEKYYRGLIQKNYYTIGSIFGKWKNNSSSYEKEKKIWVSEKMIMDNGKPAIRLEPMRLTDELRKNVFSNKIVEIEKNSISYTLMSEYGYKLHKTRPFLYAVDEKDGMRTQDKIRLIKMIEKYIEVEKWTK